MQALFRRLGQGREEIELSRDYAHPITAVWRALTDPAKITSWMGVEWLADPTPLVVGGPFNYRFNDSGLESRGRVLRLQAPNLLEHSWFENLPPASRVEWALAATAGGCRLTLTHRFGGEDDGPRTASGWTLIMERLEALLEDRAVQPSSSWADVRNQYAADFGEEAARDGKLAIIEGAPQIGFRRWIRRPIEAVWRAVSTPAGLASWLQADATIETHPGGKAHISFHAFDHQVLGEILAFDPPRLLEFTWPEAAAGSGSRVRIELEPLDAERCSLVLTHFLPHARDFPDFASGWHWHLDGLADAADGAGTLWDPIRWEALRAMYQATLA